MVLGVNKFSTFLKIKYGMIEKNRNNTESKNIFFVFLDFIKLGNIDSRKTGISIIPIVLVKMEQDIKRAIEKSNL